LNQDNAARVGEEHTASPVRVAQCQWRLENASVSMLLLDRKCFQSHSQTSSLHCLHCTRFFLLLRQIPRSRPRLPSPLSYGTSLYFGPVDLVQFLGKETNLPQTSVPYLLKATHDFKPECDGVWIRCGSILLATASVYDNNPPSLVSPCSSSRFRT
jgi:hypothetical protein